jgi:hypothetical protein
MNENETQPVVSLAAPEGSVVARATAALASGSEPVLGSKPTPPDPVKKAEEEKDETFLVARTQVEMASAQDKLIKWAEHHLAKKKVDLADAEKNLAQAKKCKWKTEPFKRLVEVATKKVVYYEKIKAALDEGYAIIPDLGVDLFAIRTTRKGAKRNDTSNKWDRPKDQQTNSPPLEEGRYVTPEGVHASKTIVLKHEPGKSPEYQTQKWAAGHDEELDFPFKTVDKSLREKIFDEIGVLPKYRQQPDPVVVGRIVYKEGYHIRRMNFLITWFIDTEDL